MNLYKSDKIRFLAGLIIIILIYSTYYIYFFDNSNRAQIPTIIKHAIMLFTTVAVYFVGTFHLGKLNDTWMSSLWHFVHISGLCIITSMGLYDWLIQEIPLKARHFVGGVQETLISPVLYVAMGLLNRTLNKDSSK